ncbi:MAG: (Fe-S)-binding protein [Candidatus Helarchaeota archaeon]|nr:(Fe-S)-binding protein [Candidatus Helarchaeota archaeon]
MDVAHLKASSINQKMLNKGEIDYDLILDCIHCGLCLNNCPTYIELGLEMDSPRGRIYLMRALSEGRINATESLFRHIDLCLECRACETACPSGVKYARLIEKTRDILEPQKKYSLVEKLLKNVVYEKILPSQKNLLGVFWFLWLYQKFGIQWIVRKLKILKLISNRLYEAETLLSDIPRPSKRKLIRKAMKPEGERRYKVGFFKGCISEFMFIDINIATVNVLLKNGCEVITPENQICCGALHIHGAENKLAKELAKKNIDVFEKLNLDAIIVNAAGCSAVLKEYPELLKDEIDYYDKAEVFSKKVKDISEFLYEIQIYDEFGEINMKVAYHDACHLSHAQGITKEPRELLKMIPGLELVEIPEPDICCGSAGIYNIIHPEMAKRLLKRKMDNIYSTGAEAVVCGNTGCIIQLLKGAENNLKVFHTIQLINLAYKNNKM